MTNTPTTHADVVTAAMSVARDAAEGRLDPASLEQQAVTELRELVGTVVGEGDPLWTLHRDIARQVLALDGVSADELAEWLAVSRQRTGEPLSKPGPEQTPPEPVAPVSDAHSAGTTDVAAQPDPQPLTLVTPSTPEPVTDPAAQPAPPPRRATRYDPLRGWSPGGGQH